MTTIRSRRSFLKVTAASAGVPLLHSNRAWAERSSNAKLKVALIGAGGIAKTAFRDCSKEIVVALADVDEKQGAEGFGQFPDADHYTDFRKMLDTHGDELDAVIVSTPDHTHFPATYDAMQRGIAVHTQKPLTHNLWQARTLQKAAEKFGVQTVMGNQGHTTEGIRFVREWYEAGVIGEVTEVHAWTNRTTKNNANGKKEKAGIAVPAGLDWDLWQGPVEETAYYDGIVPGGWRWHWPYGLGGLGDIGCHTLDTAVFALGLGMPKAVYCDKSIDFSQEFHDKAPDAEAMTYIYEFEREGLPDLKVYWYEGGHMPKIPANLMGREHAPKGGLFMVGKDNTITAMGMRPNSPRILNGWADIRSSLPEKTIPRAVGGPVKELFAAVKGEIKRPGSHFGYACPLTEIVVLGTLAMRTGKRVEYEPETLTFSDPALNALAKEPVRAGWEYGDELWA